MEPAAMVRIRDAADRHRRPRQPRRGHDDPRDDRDERPGRNPGRGRPHDQDDLRQHQGRAVDLGPTGVERGGTDGEVEERDDAEHRPRRNRQRRLGRDDQQEQVADQRQGQGRLRRIARPLPAVLPDPQLASQNQQSEARHHQQPRHQLAHEGRSQPEAEHEPRQHGADDRQRAKARHSRFEDQRHVQQREQHRQPDQRRRRDPLAGEEREQADAGQHEHAAEHRRLEGASAPPRGHRHGDHHQAEGGVDDEGRRQPVAGEEHDGPCRFRCHRKEGGDEVDDPLALADREGRAAGEEREEHPEQPSRRRGGRLDAHERGEDEEQQGRGDDRQPPRALEAPPAAPGREAGRQVEGHEDGREPEDRRVTAASRVAGRDVGGAHPRREDHQRGRRAEHVEQHLTAPQGHGEQAGIDAQQETEEQRRVLAVRRRAGHEQRKEQRQGAVHRGRLLKPPAARLPVASIQRPGAPRKAERHESEDGEGEKDPGRHGHLGRGQERGHPAPLVDGGEQKAQRDQRRPPLPMRHPAQAGIEQQEVAEQAEWVVLAARQERRRREPAHQAEQRDEYRVAAD